MSPLQQREHDTHRRALRDGILDTRTGRGAQLLAIRISLGVGVAMLVGKVYAYRITGSAAILSDAAESVVHTLAVAFAAFSLSLSIKPPDESHPYGHDRISFFSAGIEGGMIVVAGLYIIYEAVEKWLQGLELQNLGTGALFVVAAGLINAALGGYLFWTGKRHGSLILTADAKHVLTDSLTSFGVVTGLVLTLSTRWLPFDPIVAILVALNILWSGGKLVRQSVGGLMDEGDPKVGKALHSILNEYTRANGLRYHELRHRCSGNTLWVEVHLLFPQGTVIEDAHWRATEIESAIKAGVDLPAVVTTHLEPEESHDEAHHPLKPSQEWESSAGAGPPRDF